MLLNETAIIHIICTGMKIKIEKGKPPSGHKFREVMEALTNGKSIIYQFVDDKDKADFLASSADKCAKIGMVAGSLVGSVVSLFVGFQTGDVSMAIAALEACVQIGASLGYGIGIIWALITWHLQHQFKKEPLWDWFGLAPNRVRVSLALA
jgi:hypothetical protein